jgi:diadenylate cyclase
MELFKVGFINVTLIDVIDILIVTYIFYKLYLVMRGTIAAQIFVGLTLIVVISLIAQTFNMRSLGWLFSRLTDIWVIAFIILFQPEIRRVLLVLGRTRFAKYFFKISSSETITEVIDALRELKLRHHGALIVISNTSGLNSFIETGESIQAKVNKELLISIFNTRSPLHDGAVIIRNNIIEAARCILPLSPAEKKGVRKLGTRHRAGLGLSEQSNAVILILSEETGDISIADDGNLTVCNDYDELKKQIEDMLEIAPSEKHMGAMFEGMKAEK